MSCFVMRRHGPPLTPRSGLRSGGHPSRPGRMARGRGAGVTIADPVRLGRGSPAWWKGREMARGRGAGVTIADPVRLGLAEGDPVRCVMKCHEPPCRAPFRRLRRSAARLHSACRSSIAFRSTPFRSRRRRPCLRRVPFFARIACARVRAFASARFARLIAHARARRRTHVCRPFLSSSFRTGAKQETKQPADAASSCS